MLNREQAKAALLAINPGIVVDALNWEDVESEVAAAFADRNPSDDEKAAREILRQHRDYLRIEADALAVWREVFVARCAIPETLLSGAVHYANDAEGLFRLRLAAHLKAVG